MQAKQEFGKLNPNAPIELSQFAFLIGNWTFEAKVKTARRAMASVQRNVARPLHTRRLCDLGRIPDDRSGRKADCARAKSAHV